MFEDSRKTYGTRRLKKKTAEKGVHISRRRIGRLMKKAGLFCKTKNALKRRLIPSIISVYLQIYWKESLLSLNLIATMWVILPILPPRKAGYIERLSLTYSLTNCWLVDG
ncbi:IS3 family transposase [sulfur-oxidizing endosymbiont of Gigantopelta aegis]|uniref:IS3 family transposase n=1 Tax=sulfur-oxidizing endosymbiont of Gigantopelta aegis TaxID=2794934 RepID=UPI0018DB83C4